MDKLWLDIIIAVDTSSTMGQTGLGNIVNLLDRVFDGVDIGQASEDQARISIISYASSARIISNLSTYNTYTQFKAGLASIQLTAIDPVVGLYEAFEAIYQVLNGEASNGLKAAIRMHRLKQQVNRKVVCIVFASAYGAKQRDPTALIKKIKDDGQYVLTVSAMPKVGDPTDAQRIGSIASDGMNFTIDRDATRAPDDVVVTMRQALCRERKCPCTASQIWLDIVLVLDVSASMSKEGLAFAEGALATIFGELTVAQTLKQTSRIAIILFSSNATVYADLSKYNDVSELMTDLFAIPLQGDSRVNLLAGLQTAEDLFQETAEIKNRMSVVMVFTSAYSTGGCGDPATIASQIKEDGHTLMTVAYIQSGISGDDVSRIRALASPGYAFNTSDSHFAEDVISGLCQSNCFCRDNWIQYSSDFKTTGTRYGECLRFAAADASWYEASQVCHTTAPGAYLADEFSPEKHKFNSDYARSVWDKRGKPNYFVGLSYQTSLGDYAWQQSEGQALVPLDPNGYTAWGAGSPDTSGGKNCVNVAQYGFSAAWQSANCYTGATRYICQVNTCDTDNYCDDVD